VKARTNGIELEYEVLGTGEPLVLIMGIGTQLIHWPDDLCGMLVDRGFQVIRFDNRDVGMSTVMSHLGKPPLWRILTAAVFGCRVRVPYRLEDMADDTAGLMDALNLRTAHVAGVSMGGMIAQTLAIEHPARIRSLTSMLSTTGGRFPSEPHAIAALLSRPAKTRDEAIRRGVEVFTAIGSPGFERDVDELERTSGLAWDRSSDHSGFIRQLAAIVATGDRETRLHRINVPTLVIHGKADPLLPPAAGRATAHAIPGAKLELVDGLGHDMPRALWPWMADVIARNAALA